MKIKSLILRTLAVSVFVLTLSVAASAQEEAEMAAAECAEASSVENAPVAALAAGFLIIPAAVVSLRRRISKK